MGVSLHVLEILLQVRQQETDLPLPLRLEEEAFVVAAEKNRAGGYHFLKGASPVKVAWQALPSLKKREGDQRGC